ncbi:unannotated protein [freshwater metagenome]|uniref:Unannotated protein n=1 Tax=freshwater metagenome TaxID=449393 RepID=A0A6J7J8I7_9ZZZZ
MEPPPSVPTLSTADPVAAATAAPADEPPGPSSGFHGLRVIPVSGLSPTPFQPNSGVVVRPTTTAPASRSRCATGESSVARSWGSVCGEPLRVAHPRISTRSFTEAGTPSTALSGCAACQRASLAPAAKSARSESTTT